MLVPTRALTYDMAGIGDSGFCRLTAPSQGQASCARPAGGNKGDLDFPSVMSGNILKQTPGCFEGLDCDPTTG